MEKPIIVELVRVYKESESPLEKANIWSHIVAEIEEIAYKNNSDNDYIWDLTIILEMIMILYLIDLLLKENFG